jgi:8-oxo-dGTP pyrophosphatase MutT (NUDIX family)
MSDNSPMPRGDLNRDNPWKLLSSRQAYKNAWIRVREDRVIRPDGKEGIYGVVEIPPSVTIAALDSFGRVAIVEQWRYTHNRLSQELPGGSIDPKDSSPSDAAKRELAEEAGVTAASWLYCGAIENSNGATTDLAHLYLATDLDFHNDGPVAETEQCVLHWIPLRKAVELARDGTIREAPSVALLLMIRLKELKL